MPYTPPSQQSPATSKLNSPALSRSSSYSEDAPRSPAFGRPSLPRSNSASYIHKQRRSPSIKSDAPPTPSDSPQHAFAAADFAPNGSIHQSPTSGASVFVESGGVPSPPTSCENSDNDETTGEERGRELENGVEDELRLSVRGINQRRESSPEKKPGVSRTGTASEPVSQISSPQALTAEARKISHSRSSTDLYIPSRSRDEVFSTTQPSDDSDEEGRPSLVRKKSGELVKPALRPSSRRRYSSMPGTPTYSKQVHFNENENQTRHFLQVDKPIAVSAGTSPVESYDSETEFPFEEDGKGEREIKLSNFPANTFERRTKPIRIERIFLSADKNTLIGVCAVQNISFHKLVVARFTLDYWQTTSEVVAEYNNDPKNQPADGCDRFNFYIKLSDQANIDNKTLLLCVRYNVGGQEFWDNNDNSNHQVDFLRVSKKASKPKMVNGLGVRPLSAIPRSRHSPSLSARGHRESLDDDFSARFDRSSTYSLGAPESVLGESPSSIKLKPRSKRASILTNGDNGTPPTNGLGGRYDFGASLSAALSSAQEKLGRSSGLMNGAQEPSGGSYFGPIQRTEGPAKAKERPDAITTDRPAMGSDQYKDLVQKFCYFTSGSGKPAATATSNKSNNESSDISKSDASKPDPPKPVSSTDGTDDYSASSSSSGSGSSSPLFSDRDKPTSPVKSPFGSRSASPTPLTGGVLGGRAASPLGFGYPYHHNSRDGYLSDSQTPTAIHG